ncbi:peptidoglycan-binding protein [Microbacterium sp. T32]|uniref:peptidoglycan-binding protein n=1 Tax=Microbacterium sp. T32 TaxID=1776083 RepID=UPI0007AB4677|nr:peptidoglycan-binding protein [Microbacterium sp. T32]KZE41426.1 hypothetical protein AVW09_02220 [Microbacterium sp. T32]
MRYPNGSTNRPEVTSPFGPREASGNASTYHRGGDMVGFEIIRAVASGIVRCSGSAPAGWSNGGDQVWIQHDGFFSKSLHQARSLVSDGTYVNEGDAVGVMGSSGSAQGKHLHFEITPGQLHFGNYGQVDPLAFLAARISGGSDFPARDAYGAEHVEALQNELRAVGYDITVDGYDGSQTQAAVRDFQSKNGLKVDGIGGPATRAALQSKAAEKVGRNITSRPTSEVQQLVGANPDGIYGPDTTAKVADWQRAHGLEPDGIWGPASDAVGFPTSEQLELDGDLGPKTIKALQISLGFTGEDVDGELGPKTIKALQAALGFTGDDLDGEIGPKTREALQRALSVNVDGDWGVQTIKALQNFLNHGSRFTAAPTPTPTPSGSEGIDNRTGRSIAQIGDFLASLGYSRDRAGVIAFQASKSIDQDGIWGSTSDGLAFPPAGSVHGVDYSFARPDPAMLYSRGIRHAGRYLWPNSKGITRPEFDALSAAGIAVWFIYEEDGRELLGGRDAGVVVARKAEALLTSLGLSNYPIYFNVDFDAADGDLAQILAALDGAASVIGRERVGLYAGYRIIKAAFDAGKITWGFQTYAWSGGQWDARAHLQQWSNGQWGDTVDFTRAVAGEYGQLPVTRTPDAEPEPTPEPEKVLVDKKLLDQIKASWSALGGLLSKLWS